MEGVKLFITTPFGRVNLMVSCPMRPSASDDKAVFDVALKLKFVIVFSLEPNGVLVLLFDCEGSGADFVQEAKQ